MTRERSEIDETLGESGAILFRGFDITSEEAFQRVVDSVAQDRMHYIYRSTPRHEVADRIYTATEYPKTYPIPLHNENSFQRDWPMRLLFCCSIPAASGGNTPLAHTKKVTQRIDPGIREMFKRNGVMYVRNYGMGVDLSWEVVFQTNDRNEVESFCRLHGLEFEWLPRNCLRTRQVCQGMAVHPRTGDELWFNQAHLFHPSSLDAQTLAGLRRFLKPEELPRNAYLGDGAEISDDILNHVRSAFEVEKAAFNWERGDVLLLDNMLVCHGREPFEGERRILVAMAQPYSSMAAAIHS